MELEPGPQPGLAEAGLGRAGVPAVVYVHDHSLALCSDFRLFIEFFDATIHGPDLARVEGHGGKLHLLEHHLG